MSIPLLSFILTHFQLRYTVAKESGEGGLHIYHLYIIYTAFRTKVFTAMPSLMNGRQSSTSNLRQKVASHSPSNKLRHHRRPAPPHTKPPRNNDPPSRQASENCQPALGLGVAWMLVPGLRSIRTSTAADSVFASTSANVQSSTLGFTFAVTGRGRKTPSQSSFLGLV